MINKIAEYFASTRNLYDEVQAQDFSQEIGNVNFSENLLDHCKNTLATLVVKVLI